MTPEAQQPRLAGGGRSAVVTGSTGFIGRALTRALVSHGWQVRGLDVRPGPYTEVADVSRGGAWRDAFAGADLVLHTAAVVDACPRSSTTFWQVNVAGTRNVLAAAARHDVGRVVHLSSIVVHGTTFTDGVDETGAVRMTGNPYTDTKVAAEHQALLATAGGHVPVTIIRPGDVYGPHSQPWTVRPVELIRRGVFVLPGSGHGVLSPVYVDDVVDATLTAAVHPEAVGSVFHVTGGVGVSVADFFGSYAEQLGVGLRSLPTGAATWLTRPVDVISRGLGRTPPFSPRAIEYLTRPGTFSISRARDVLGWTPAVSLTEGMDRTHAWLREVGLLPTLAGGAPETEPVAS